MPLKCSLGFLFSLIISNFLIITWKNLFEKAATYYPTKEMLIITFNMPFDLLIALRPFYNPLSRLTNNIVIF